MSVPRHPTERAVAPAGTSGGGAVRGHRRGLAFTLTWLGSIVPVKTGDAGAAREVFEQSL